MNYETKKQLKNKARLAHGLLEVLKFDIDILREDCDIYSMRETVQDTDKTLRRLSLLVEEIEYILNLDKEKRL